MDIILFTVFIIIILKNIKKKFYPSSNDKKIKRKAYKSYLLEAIFLLLIIYVPTIINSFFGGKGFFPDNKFFTNKVAYYLTAAIFAYNVFEYIKNTIIQHNIAAIPYRPIYLIDKLYLNKDLTKRERNKKEVLIKVNFPESSTKLRNVNVYKINDEDMLETLTSYYLLNNNDTVYDGSLKNDLLLVGDTHNRERIFTLITEHSVMSAIDKTYRLNFHIDDLVFIPQDPMYETDKDDLIERLRKIIEKSLYYKKTK